MQSSRTNWTTLIGRVFLALAVAYVLLNLGRAIQKNSEINQAITRLKAEIASLESQIRLLKFEIAYEQSDAYRNLEAKRRLGVRARGETVVLVPQNADPKTTTERPLLPPRDDDTVPKSFFERASDNARSWLIWITTNTS